MIAEKEFLSPGMPGAVEDGEDSPPPSPLMVRQGGGPFSAGRSHRRRRSAAPLARPVPAEMPDDGAGRVRYIAAAPPADVRPEAGSEVSPPAATTSADPPSRGSAAGPAPRALTLLDGWTAVALAAALVVVVFLLGMAVTR